MTAFLLKVKENNDEWLGRGVGCKGAIKPGAIEVVGEAGKLNEFLILDTLLEFIVLNKIVF